MESGNNSDITGIWGGIVFQSGLTEGQDFQYKIRMGVIEVPGPNGMTDMAVEGKTNDLFDRTIVSFLTNFDSCTDKGKSFAWECVEERYQDFVLMQSMIDSAYIRLSTQDKSFLPLSTEETCMADMVIFCSITNI